MGYVKTTWTNGKTKLNAKNLNNIETGIEENKDALIDINSKILTKQDKLVSGTNIKTINGETILGQGDIEIQGGGSTITFSELAKYTKYGVFRINGTETENTNIELPVGEVYELSGYFKGHIILKATESPENPGKFPGKPTQVILNNFYCESDSVSAISTNQTDKKLVVTIADNSENFISTVDGSTECGAIDADKCNLCIISGNNATLTINAKQHGINGQHVYLSGAGLVNITAVHDAIHGAKLIRFDAGNLVINNAKDAFGTGAEGIIQVVGGNINIKSCTEDAFDSQGNGGVVAGYNTTIIFGDGVTSLFKNMTILETVPEIHGYDEPRTTLIEYYGEPMVIADGVVIEPTDDGYVVNKKEITVTVKGYLDRPIILEKTKIDLYFNKACINTETASIIYEKDSSRVALRSEDNVEEINYLTGGIFSGHNIVIQDDSSYIINNDINCDQICIKGDGYRYFKDINANKTIYIGGEPKDIGEDGTDKLDKTDFAINTIIAKNIQTREAVKILYGQIGLFECNYIDGIFYKDYLGILKAEEIVPVRHINKQSIVFDTPEYIYLRAKIASLEIAASDSISTLQTKVAELEERIAALEPDLVEAI